MTMTRETKTDVQMAATGTCQVRSESPRQIREYGRYLPLEIGREFAVLCTRPNRTHNRTREMVINEKAALRRTIGRRRVL